MSKMKLQDILKTENIEKTATIGRPGYAMSGKNYHIWDGDQWIGEYRPDANGEMVKVDPWAEIASAPIVKTR